MRSFQKGLVDQAKGQGLYPERSGVYEVDKRQDGVMH